MAQSVPAYNVHDHVVSTGTSSYSSRKFSCLFLFLFQVSSPYPLSITRSSSPSHTRATYLLTLLPDYHCPPEPPFTALNVSFLCTITNQEEFISVSFLESDLSCPDDPAALPVGTPLATWTRGKGALPPFVPTYFPYILVTILALILATIVVCMALSKSSSHAESGFSEHLPPADASLQPLSPSASGTPFTSPQQSLHMPPPSVGAYQTPAFNASRHAATPTPSFSMAGASKRTSFSSSPTQHGLFSQ